jgi:hypothetical protein
VFAVPTRTHMKYQTSQNFPWWFRTYVLRRKGLAKPQLYKFNNEEYIPKPTVAQKAELATAAEKNELSV